LGHGAFAYFDPPFDPARLLLRHPAQSPETLVDLEMYALNRGHDAFKQIIKSLNATGIWDRRSKSPNNGNCTILICCDNI